jgi:hypothetical protein
MHSSDHPSSLSHLNPEFLTFYGQVEEKKQIKFPEIKPVGSQ